MAGCCSTSRFHRASTALPGLRRDHAGLDLFCTPCWGQLHFLSGGCELCGCPVQPGEGNQCAGCAAHPGPLDRSRAALAYGEIPRSVAMRLKYGRKIALARTMAVIMQRPLSDPVAR